LYNTGVAPAGLPVEARAYLVARSVACACVAMAAQICDIWLNFDRSATSKMSQEFNRPVEPPVGVPRHGLSPFTESTEPRHNDSCLPRGSTPSYDLRG